MKYTVLLHLHYNNSFCELMERAEITLNELMKRMHCRLAEKFERGEADAMVRVVMQHLKGWSAVELVLKRDSLLSDYISDKALSIVDRVMADEPLQYVLGETRFYGNTFVVSPAVLIPRPETEELVDIIVKQNHEADLSVLDLCTGSGCIAVSLARSLRFPVVEAVDLSLDALAVARENARRLRVDVAFSCKDVLTLVPNESKKYDIIVSNPPYVLESERCRMAANVLDHEPAMALFVPDDDALRFYRVISEYAIKTLKCCGTLYFEINPLEAENVAKMLLEDGFEDVDILTDMAGKKRFAIAKRNGKE